MSLLINIIIWAVVMAVLWIGWGVICAEVPFSAAVAKLGRIVIIAIAVISFLVWFLAPYLSGHGAVIVR